MRRIAAPALRFLISGALLMPLLAGPVTAQDAVDVGALAVYTERVKTGFVNWGAGYAEVVVEAPYETERYGGSHAKIRAIEAADTMSHQAFYRLLRGINLTGEQRLAGEPELEEILRLVSSKQSKLHNQKTANVTMTATYRMSIYGRKALSGLVREKMFSGTEGGTLAGTSGGGYTSVILDAAGTSLQAALFPRLLDENGVLLFGPGDVGSKTATPAVYVVRDSGADKKLRISKPMAKVIGANPLVLKVQKVGGDFFADVVLRPEQVEALTAAKPGDLLAQGHLFIIQTNSIDVSGS